LTNDGDLGSSFRDPSGFVFAREGVFYRQVNERCRADYDLLLSSGLYEGLTRRGLLIAHEEVSEPVADAALHYKTLRPEQLDFLSHPYEWCFSQLKDAALTTLRVQREALAVGMTLKDSSAYNIQFQRGRPLLIDTLSFTAHRDGSPWVGYRQFCQHFLAPLALMSRRDVRLLGLLRVHLDGIPLDLATALLPASSWWKLGLLTNIRLHARSQRRYEGQGASAPVEPPRIATSALLNLVRGLEQTVRSLDWRPEGTEWADYYDGDSYEAAALDHKQALVSRFLTEVGPQSVWDLGANTGVYSRIASGQGARVVSFDVDPACVERNYRQAKQQKEERILPLLLDLANPSPAIGWANRERETLEERSGPELLLALALIHHIAISNNVPLARISAYFARLAPWLVIEFVPKSDAKVKTLLATREDVFDDYTREAFEAAFAADWDTLEAMPIEGSERVLYRMRRR
jgi:hypothetical protein